MYQHFVACILSFQEGNIEIHREASVIDEKLELRASGNIRINTTIHGKEFVKMHVNSDCINEGTIQIQESGEFLTSNKNMLIWGGSIEINEETGIINTGSLKILKQFVWNLSLTSLFFRSLSLCNPSTSVSLNTAKFISPLKNVAQGILFASFILRHQLLEAVYYILRHCKC